MNISIITRASGDICIKYNLTFVIFTTEYTLVYILNCNERLMQSCNITRLFVGFVKQVKNNEMYILRIIHSLFMHSIT